MGHLGSGGVVGHYGSGLGLVPSIVISVFLSRKITTLRDVICEKFSRKIASIVNYIP